MSEARQLNFLDHAPDDVEGRPWPARCARCGSVQLFDQPSTRGLRVRCTKCSAWFLICGGIADRILLNSGT